jgi:type I restriction enzyme, S subunit
LGKIAAFSKGKGISKSDITENGEFECIRYGELYTYYDEVIDTIKSRTNSKFENLVFSEANDVIIPASGETQIDIAKASCVIKTGVALGSDLNIIKTKNNGIFLSYYLNNKKKKDIANLAQGISVVHLYSSQLALLNIDLPCIEEQTKIANFLMVIDEKINHCQSERVNTEVWKKGLLQQMFI